MHIYADKVEAVNHFLLLSMLKEYKKLYPKRDIFVISSIEEDKSIDSLKPKRINVHNQTGRAVKMHEFVMGWLLHFWDFPIFTIFFHFVFFKN